MVRIMRAPTIATSTFMLMVVLILSFQPYQVAHSETAVPLESKAHAYVMNVLPFNMSHYTITVGNAYSLPSAPNDSAITQAVVIDLKSCDSTIHVVCVYVNGALHQCGVSPTGNPVSDRTYANVKDVAIRMLQANQEQTGLDSSDLLNTLNLVNETETRIVTLGDVSLSISQFPDIIELQTVNGMPVPVASNSSFSTTFDWRFNQNGVQQCQIALTFDKGIFRNLQDERAIQRMGDNGSIRNEPAMTPTQALSAVAQQQNLTASSSTFKPTNVSSTQANQSQTESSQKTEDTKNEIIMPILIISVVSSIIVVIIGFTWKNKIKQIKEKSQKETKMGLFLVG